MPRLIGKRSNASAHLTLSIIAVAAVLTGLEYIGAINVINGFGNDKIEILTYPSQDQY
jgi:hypothetical protein